MGVVRERGKCRDVLKRLREGSGWARGGCGPSRSPRTGWGNPVQHTIHRVPLLPPAKSPRGHPLKLKHRIPKSNQPVIEKTNPKPKRLSGSSSFTPD